MSSRTGCRDKGSTNFPLQNFAHIVNAKDIPSMIAGPKTMSKAVAETINTRREDSTTIPGKEIDRTIREEITMVDVQTAGGAMKIEASNEIGLTVVTPEAEEVRTNQGGMTTTIKKTIAKADPIIKHSEL